MQNPQQKQPFQDLRAGLNIFSWLCSGYATAILPFIRKDFGTEFFGLNALVAVFVMLIFGAAENANEMLAYMGVWLVLVVAHRLDAARAYRKGRIIHSRYAGDSWLAGKLLRSPKNKTLKLILEPGLCLAVGMLVCPYSLGIGRFLILGSFAVFMFNGLQRAIMEQRVRRMRDAHIEQQSTADGFRNGGDDW